MKKYSIDDIFGTLLKYLWLICTAVFVLEIIFTVNMAAIFTKNTSGDIMFATRNELENKLNVTWKLADAMAQDVILTNTSISLEERALFLSPYNEVYELFLIGITDENGRITSTYDNIPGEIGYRDYFKQAMETGESVITDAFPAGADGTTLNYTICVPYFDGRVSPAGVIIMSIPFDGVNEMITNVSSTSGYMFTLLGSDHKVMAEADKSLVGVDFSQMLEDSVFVSTDREQVVKSVEEEKNGTYWTVENGRLLYVAYAPISRTPWTLLTSIDVLESCKPIVLSAVVKLFLLILVFSGVSYLGKKYMATKLADTGSMLKQMEKLQDNLREEKLITSDTLEELVSISKSGLIDSLTGLPTRFSVKKMIDEQLEKIEKNADGILVLIDLDDLKSINDTYGHVAGDRAIAAFGESLRSWAKETGGAVGRFGGDEFIAFLSGGDYYAVVDKMMNELNIEIKERDSSILLHASAGVAQYPACGDDFQQLYIAADTAMYKAKRNGKNCYVFYDEEQQ